MKTLTLSAAAVMFASAAIAGGDDLRLKHGCIAHRENIVAALLAPMTGRTFDPDHGTRRVEAAFATADRIMAYGGSAEYCGKAFLK